MKNKLLILSCFLSINFWAQNTYVPDDNFEQALIDLGYDNVLDDYVLTSNITSVTSLQISNRGIQDLTGIENFTSLQQLFVHNNALTTINLSSNTALKRLDAFENQITNVDVKNNVNLEVLFLYSNQITNIDLSNNTKIYSLRLDYNNLSSLDITNNLSLQYFYAGNNQLKTMDLSLNNQLIGVWIENNQFTEVNIKNGNNGIITHFSVTNNPDLKCITVDYITNNRPIAWAKDNTATYNTDCTPKTYVPDDNFEQALIDLGYDDVLDNYVLTENIMDVTSLNVSHKNISDLTGIQDFSSLSVLNCSSNKLTYLFINNNTALTELYCGDNQLNSLNVNSNTLLTKLYCGWNNLYVLDVDYNLDLKELFCQANNLSYLNVYYNEKLTSLGCNYNQISSLDVTNNLLLIGLFCDNNKLTSLYLRNNIDLIHLNCSSNELTSLNVKNGSNSSFTIFRAWDNPNLYCIEVDDVAYSNANWTSVDDIVTFRESCTNFDETLNRFADNVTGNWNDAANWSLGHVPSSGEVVEIPSTSNITIGKDDVVEVEKIFSSGYIDLKGKLTITDKYVNTGALNFNSYGSFITEQATGKGTYILNKNSYNGNDLHPDNWYLVALPGNDIVAQSVISNSTLASGTGTNKGLAIYDNASSINGGWHYLSSTSQDVLKPGIGFATKVTSNSSTYLRKFQSNIDSEFLVSDYNIDVTNSLENGWNLIGNPYLASIPANSSMDGSSFLEMNESKLARSYVALYFWNPNTNSYDVVNKATSPTFIKPMEGFFVNIASFVEQVAFKSSSLVHLPEAISSRALNTAVEISLIVEDGEKRKMTNIKYLENSTKGLDVGYDAGLFNAEKESFSVYSTIQDDNVKTPLTLQCLPESELYNGKIAIGVKIPVGREITIRAISANLPEGTVLLLEDTLKNVFVDVSKPESFYKTMLVSEEEESNRFFLHTVSKTLSNDDVNQDDVKIIKTDSNHILINGLEEEGEIFMYTIEGKLVSQEKINSVNNIVTISNKAHGVYIVNLVLGNKRVTKKIVL